jgi:hypothetical protein
MREKSTRRQCKSCGKEIARSVKKCPYCGQAAHSGWFLKLTIAGGALALLGAFAIPAYQDPVRARQDVMFESVDSINATDLAKMLDPAKKPTSSQVEWILEEITGKIVEWQLPVFVVTEMPDHFNIVTKPDTDVPGTLLTVYPTSHHDKKYLENLKAGTSITIKGKITGMLKGRVKINPAFLI